MASLLDALGQLCVELAVGQHKPNARWLRDILLGAFISRSLKLSEIGRALDDTTKDGEPRRLKHTHKRLSLGLNSERQDDAALLHAHLTRAAKSLRVNDGEGVVIALDGTMLVKPRSRTDERGQEMCRPTWDNARGEVSTGYPMVAIAGVDAKGRRRPLLLRPYSTLEDGHTNRSDTHLAALASVVDYVGSRAVVVVDRGYAGRRTYAGLDEIGLDWVCRERTGKNSRRVMTRNGEILSLTDLVYRTLPTIRTTQTEGRGRKRKTRVYDISRRKVRIIGANGEPEGPWRTVIACWSDYEDPLVLMVSDWRPSKDEVLAAVHAWKKRWDVERFIQDAKAKSWGFDLNSIRALTLRGVRRLCLVASIMMAFVEEVAGQGDIVRRCLRRFASFDHSPTPNNIAQRLIRGMSGLLGRKRRQELAEWHGELAAKHRPRRFSGIA